MSSTWSHYLWTVCSHLIWFWIRPHVPLFLSLSVISITSLKTLLFFCVHTCLFSHPLRWSTDVLHLCGMQLCWSIWPLTTRTARSTPWATVWLTGATASQCSMAVPTGTSSLRGTVWWDSYYPYVASRLWGTSVIQEVIFNLNVAFKVRVWDFSNRVDHGWM